METQNVMLEMLDAFRNRFVAIALILIACCPNPTLLGQETPNFRLPATDGSTLEIEPVDSEEKETYQVLCFLGVECPLAKLYGPRLQSLSEKYKSRGVKFIGIDSNLQDSMPELKAYVEQSGILFPVGKDYDQKVAEHFGAKRTPEVFVVDSHLGIRYRGRIDDQYLPGIVKASPQNRNLQDAIDRLLDGKKVETPLTEAVGCLIGRPKKPIDNQEVTYVQQIRPLFEKHCVECHRPGEIGPFDMTEVDSLRGWGDMIWEVVEQGRMPPWHATDNHLALRNARSMSAEERTILKKWIDAGMPYGSEPATPSQTSLAAAAASDHGEAKSVSDWRLPHEPDFQIAMRSVPYSVPSEGTVEYQYFVVDPQFKEDKWVTSAQIIPGNPSVVHHAIVFIRPPDGTDFVGVGWLTAFVPGQRSMVFPPGAARRIPAGSKLVFQMHYTPNGKPQEDLSRVGMLFTDREQVQEEVITLIGIDQEFDIPPMVTDHPVKAKVRWFPKEGKLLAAAPHMHVRGKSFRLEAIRGSERQTLLEVPRYDFNWQHTYEWQEPIPLSSIDRIEFVATFDNSPNNPVNPNPSEHVYWGDQTWEEMAVTFLEVSRPLKKEAESVDEKARTNASNSKQKDSHEPEAYAEGFLKRLDRNRDGYVDFGEAPIVIQRFSFGRFDKNKDQRIDREELIEAAKSR